MNEEKKLNEIIKEHAEARNLNTAKLAELSGVPERYIDALCTSDFSFLPPAPYIRGYLFKIGAVLETPGSDLWATYKKEIAPQSSGALDRLPSNRFSIQPLSKKWVLIALGGAAIGAYLVFALPSVLGEPTLKMSAYSEEKTYLVSSANITLSGTVRAGDKITLNNEPIYTDLQGNFEKEVALQKGLNTEELVVSRFLGRTKKIIRQFDYEPPAGQNKPSFSQPQTLIPS